MQDTKGIIKLLGHCIGDSVIFIPGRGSAISSAQEGGQVIHIIWLRFNMVDKFFEPRRRAFIS